mmetsp:Transcript_1651/g.2682  ORF Transcript_1651/g.2682 Transcript_1651/m.2682 type:complete len:85 (+) Transcript_1651:211-465(+)
MHIATIRSMETSCRNNECQRIHKEDYALMKFLIAGRSKDLSPHTAPVSEFQRFQVNARKLLFMVEFYLLERPASSTNKSPSMFD